MNNMKRFMTLTAIFLGVILFSAGVFAECSPSDRIMRISGTSNAHGEEYDFSGLESSSTGYIDICYSDIFGQGYGGAVSHVCETDGSNLVLRLSADTNAHAEGPAGSNYLTKVCYSGLTNCRLASSCNTGETEIIRLSGVTNAHLAEEGYSGYSNMICCGGAGPPIGEIGEVYWENYADERATEMCIGDDVKLVAENGFTEGINTEFVITETNWFDEEVTGLPKFLISVDDFEKWTIAAGENVSEGSNLIFDIETETSGSLHIKNADECVNTPPTAQILSPVHRGVYFVNTPITFEGKCLDRENEPIYNWEVEGVSLGSFVDDNKFTLPLSEMGATTVTLECIDSKDTSLSDSEQISILMIGASSISAFIEEPEHEEYMIKNELYINGITRIGYKAEDSYVVESSFNPLDCSGSVNCLAGKCPSQTQPHPSCGAVNINNPNQGYEKLDFQWVFEDNLANPYGGLGVSSGGKYYGSAGKKKIDLTLKYNIAPYSLQDTFTREFILEMQCKGNGATYYEINPITGKLRSVGLVTSGSENACSGPDGSPGGGDDCCPSGQICGATGCHTPTEDPPVNNLCSRYDNEDDCLDDDYGAADKINYPGLWTTEPDCDDDDVECFCGWIDDACEFTKIEYEDPNGYPPPPPPKKTTCTYYNPEYGECINGYMTVTVRLKSGDPLKCTAEDIPDARCGLYQAIELPFFGFMQFVLSVVSICILYFIFLEKLKIFKQNNA